MKKFKLSLRNDAITIKQYFLVNFVLSILGFMILSTIKGEIYWAGLLISIAVMNFIMFLSTIQIKRRQEKL